MNKSDVRPKILIVDDKPQNLYALEKLLAQLEVGVIQTTSGLEALRLILDHEFCLAIVDVQMPEMDGYELVELLRGNPKTATLPVIFVSAIHSDEYHHRKGYDAGAVDFLSKPFVPEILLSKVKVFLDLYHQRIKLQELYELEKKLNADKDKFFSIISHDLRTPFNGLLNNTLFLVEMLDELSPAEIREISRCIYDQTEVTHHLLENLLTWSQMQRGRMEYKPGPIHLYQLAQNTVAVLQDVALSKEIQLEQTIAEDLFAEADENMIDTVMRNLTSNALKFTPAGGQVTLSARLDKNSMAAGNSDKKCIEVSVKDTGMGISREDIDKLFKIEIHHTTSGTAEEKGAGLGLILCKEMVEKNKGRIWIESELGKGTTVKFTLPIVPAHSKHVNLMLSVLDKI